MVSALAGVLPPGAMIGSYRIESVLGEGGMGVVYLAHQLNPARPVALKVIRAGAAGSTTLRRFQREAQLLGRLQHPGIAPIFEAGTAQIVGGIQQPFLAMELVEGKSLTDYAHAANLDLRARLDLLAKVCDAVDHAHRRGLVHRDLKPSNILVTPAGQPKVLDFGVARAVDADATLATEQGQLLGTLAYMSPEQIAGGGAAADARSDVYALGVILYQLLTGRTPHEIQDKTVIDGARLIRETDPPRPSQITRSLRGDVENHHPHGPRQRAATLPLPDRRLPRRRHPPLPLGHPHRGPQRLRPLPPPKKRPPLPLVPRRRPRLHRPHQRLEHLGRNQRPRLPPPRPKRIRRQRRCSSQRARSHRTPPRWQHRARPPPRHQRRHALRRRHPLERHGRAGPGAIDAYWALCEMYSRFPVIGRIGLGERVHWVRFSRDGSRLAAAGFDGAVALYDVRSNRALWKHTLNKNRINTVCFSPDESILATAGLDAIVRLWNASDGAPRGELPGHPGSDAEAHFTPDGKQIVSGGSDNIIRIWDVASRTLLRQLPGTGRPVAALRLSPDGKRLLIGDTSGALQLLDFDSGSQLWQSPLPHRLRPEPRLQPRRPFHRQQRQRQYHRPRRPRLWFCPQANQRPRPQRPRRRVQPRRHQNRRHLHLVHRHPRRRNPRTRPARHARTAGRLARRIHQRLQDPRHHRLPRQHPPLGRRRKPRIHHPLHRCQRRILSRRQPRWHNHRRRQQQRRHRNPHFEWLKGNPPLAVSVDAPLAHLFPQRNHPRRRLSGRLRPSLQPIHRCTHTHPRSRAQLSRRRGVLPRWPAPHRRRPRRPRLHLEHRIR